MESYYTWTNFYQILMATAVVTYGMYKIAMVQNTRFRLLTTLVVILTINWAMVPITPYSQWLRIMGPLQWLELPVLVLWLFTYWRINKKNDFSRYQDWIIDSLRESIIVLDSRGKVEWTNSPVVQDVFLKTFQESIQNNIDQGLITHGQQTLRYQLHPLDQGYLGYLVDFTREQELILSLRNKNTQLEQRLQFLNSLEKNLENQNLQQAQEDVKLDIQQSIQALVDSSLGDFRSALVETRDISELLVQAEKSLQSIRTGVTLLKTWEN